MSIYPLFTELILVTMFFGFAFSVFLVLGIIFSGHIDMWLQKRAKK